MKCQIILPACLLLLWTLTASAPTNEKKKKVKVTIVSDGIVLSCPDNYLLKSEKSEWNTSLKLPFQDDKSGEFRCEEIGEKRTDDNPKLFVKFRTCDNCIELDEAALAGMIVGNVVATTVIGVAVYLIASQTRISPTTSHKKSSDRQQLVPNEGSSRAFNEHYQPLNLRSGQKETYDVLKNRK
uniref:CD3 gamma/delta n=1 Tax=Lateolabrax japonicus TaxID=8164 RepID=A0A1B0WVD6_LATJA|nr:CD3 gamma/delta [Lateolabrax japonicus]